MHLGDLMTCEAGRLGPSGCKQQFFDREVTQKSETDDLCGLESERQMPDQVRSGQVQHSSEVVLVNENRRRNLRDTWASVVDWHLLGHRATPNKIVQNIDLVGAPYYMAPHGPCLKPCPSSTAKEGGREKIALESQWLAHTHGRQDAQPAGSGQGRRKRKRKLQTGKRACSPL